MSQLPYTFDEFQIRELVAGFDVSWVNMINNDRGFSGMATVKFATQEEAKTAMSELLHAEADGRRLIPSFQGGPRRTDNNSRPPRRRFNDGGEGGHRREGNFRRRDNSGGGRGFDSRGGSGFGEGKRYSNNYFDNE